jgi:toxin ParE1/3/4
MPYLVNITARAERDVASLYDQIHAGHSSSAHAWFNGLKQAVLSLQEMPVRCPITPENGQLRHLLYGHKPHIYRVIYRILEKQKTVEVLHIRYGARHAFDAQDPE